MTSFKTHFSTVDTHSIAISNTFIIVQDISITTVITSTSREQVWFCYLITPVLGSNQLSTNVSIDILVNNTAVVLIWIWEEANWLNQAQILTSINIPWNWRVESNIFTYNCLISITIELLDCFAIRICILSSQASNYVNNAVNYDAITRNILLDCLTESIRRIRYIAFLVLFILKFCSVQVKSHNVYWHVGVRSETVGCPIVEQLLTNNLVILHRQQSHVRVESFRVRICIALSSLKVLNLIRQLIVATLILVQGYSQYFLWAIDEWSFLQQDLHILLHLLRH